MAEKRIFYLLIFFLLTYLLSCTNVVNKEMKKPCNGSQKITGIYKEFVYDLSGYAGSGGSTPFKLFDENDHFDPKNGITGSAETSPQPTIQPDIFFPLNKGNRIVVDLRIPYKLNEAYVYDHSYSSDSIWIYTGSMGNWKLQTTFLTKGDPMGWGWRKFSLQDSSQLLMIR